MDVIGWTGDQLELISRIPGMENGVLDGLDVTEGEIQSGQERVATAHDTVATRDAELDAVMGEFSIKLASSGFVDKADFTSALSQLRANRETLRESNIAMREALETLEALSEGPDGLSTQDRRVFQALMYLDAGSPEREALVSSLESNGIRIADVLAEADAAKLAAAEQSAEARIAHAQAEASLARLGVLAPARVELRGLVHEIYAATARYNSAVTELERAQEALRFDTAQMAQETLAHTLAMEAALAAARAASDAAAADAASAQSDEAPDRRSAQVPE